MSTVTHVISVSLVPADAMAALKLRAAIDDLRAQDPALGVTTGPVNEIVLHGIGELHLEVAVDCLKRGYFDFQVGAPEMHYRESITKTIEWDYTHKRQTGGNGEYAKVKIRFQPGEPGSGFQFANKAGDSVPAVFVPGVEKGLAAACEEGPVAGFPLMDVACTLIDGGYHDADSNERTFEIAARACLREAIPKAGPMIMEPMMLVVVLTPQDHLGDVIGDLNKRRGQVQGMDNRCRAFVVAALVPLANLLGYVNALKSMTRGRANCMMEFERYEPMPPARGPDDDNFPPAIGMRA